MIHSNLELLVTLGFLGALMWTMMKFMLRDIHKDLIDLKAGQEEIKADMKAYKEKTDLKFSQTDQRLDHLYQTLVDLVKENRK